MCPNETLTVGAWTKYASEYKTPLLYEQGNITLTLFTVLKNKVK